MSLIIIINVWKQFQSSMSETLNCGKLIHVPKKHWTI